MDLNFSCPWLLSNLTLSMLDALALQLAHQSAPGMAFGLSGELGAGKTTLIQHWCRHLGVIDAVNSPSFGYLHTYQGQAMPVLHADLYRATPVERVTPELMDCLPTHLLLIEWAECWPDGRFLLTGDLHLTINRDGTRQLSYQPVN